MKYYQPCQKVMFFFKQNLCRTYNFYQTYMYYSFPKKDGKKNGSISVPAEK